MGLTVLYSFSANTKNLDFTITLVYTTNLYCYVKLGNVNLNQQRKITILE